MERDAIVTVSSFGEEPKAAAVVQTNKLPMPDEESRRLERANAIAPPYYPGHLAAIYEQSSGLHPPIAALQENVDGHGHRLEPTFDPTKPNARDIVANAIMFERALSIGLRNEGSAKTLLASELDIDVRLAEINVRMLIEKMRLDAFYSACTPGTSFVKMRKRWRKDLEVTGNAYRGIRRDNRGEIAELEYLPSVMMRIRPVVSQNGVPLYVPVRIPVRRTPVTIEYVTTHRAFRTFVQFGLTREVYFKEFGDPRCYSSVTGELVNSVDDLRPGEPPATELQHIKIDSLLYEYGVPRWIGATPSVTGLRASQEVNATHFDHNAIPRMMFLISGGALKDGAEEKLKTLLKTHAQGRNHYGGCIILQATPASNNPQARVTIEAKPLKEAVPDDGLFLNYGARCRDEILSQWRLPKFAVGQLEDVNKATASEGMQFVENQVYQPMRHEFDEDMDLIHTAENIHFWKFVSNSPLARDPETSTRIIEGLSKAGGQSINDARRGAAEILNQSYKPLKEPWAEFPIEIAKLVFAAGGASGGSSNGQGAVSKGGPQRVSSPYELAQWLITARDALLRGEAATFAAETTEAMGSPLVVPLSGDTLAELVNFA